MQCFEAADRTAPASMARRVPGIAFPLPIQQASTVAEAIYLIDDDPRVLEALSELLEALGKHVVCFSTAQEYLNYRRSDSSACLIVDLMLPDMNGIDLQRQLAGCLNPPIIFISGHADVPSTVRAMKGGAVEFLTKPISQKALVVAIEAALLTDRLQRQRRLEMDCLRDRYSLLTARERQVFQLVAEGMLNKQAASVLGISEVTLQVHRGQVMRKMAAGSFAALVRMAMALGVLCRDGERTPDPSHGQQGHPLASKDKIQFRRSEPRSTARSPRIA